MSNKTIKIEGTAIELGSGVFKRLCAPALNACSKGMSMDQLMLLHAGFISSAFGAMAADFGKEGALVVLQKLVESFEAMDLSAEAKH